MNFAKKAAVVGAVGAVLGIGLTTPAIVSAADASAASAQAAFVKPASRASAEVLANAILDRWEPVAIEAGVHSSTWRDVLYTSLRLMDVSVLQSLDEVRGDTQTNAKTAYAKFTQAIRSAIMQSYQQGLGGKGHMKLALTTNDQVFIPITPCRILDTRMIGGPPNSGGPIASGTSRRFFFYYTESNWSWATGAFGSAGQGGAAGLATSACPGTMLTTAQGTLGSVAPSAAVATVTAANTTAAGNFIIWGGAGAAPATSAVNWLAGQAVANTTVIPAGGRGAVEDFAIQVNGPSGQADAIVDVIGYFVENHATELDCIQLNASGPIGAGSNGFVSYPACTTGYTRTGGFCVGLQGTILFDTGPVACGIFNPMSTAISVTAATICCRVPGQ